MSHSIVLSLASKSTFSNVPAQKGCYRRPQCGHTRNKEKENPELRFTVRTHGKQRILELVENMSGRQSAVSLLFFLTCTRIHELVHDLSPLLREDSILSVIKALPVLADLLRPLEGLFADEMTQRLLGKHSQEQHLKMHVLQSMEAHPLSAIRNHMCAESVVFFLIP